jgi:hypothetical protein
MPPALWNLADDVLDGFQWLLLRFRSAGVPGGYNHDQSFDFSNACGNCGAGAQPLPTLVANLTEMRKKSFGYTAHEGQIIVRTELAEAISRAGLTGFSIRPVLHINRGEPDERYRWLRIDSQWPRMQNRRILAVEDQCPICGRAGHFDTYAVPTEFWYEAPPVEACDFNFTWEFFGVWRHHLLPHRRPIGGKRVPIVSQRVRAFLSDHAVKSAFYDPVFFERKPA